MPTLDELDYGPEIRGCTCPACGGSVVRKGKRRKPFCPECEGFVKPHSQYDIDWDVQHD